MGATLSAKLSAKGGGAHRVPRLEDVRFQGLDAMKKMRVQYTYIYIYISNIVFHCISHMSKPRFRCAMS